MDWMEEGCAWREMTLPLGRVVSLCSEPCSSTLAEQNLSIRFSSLRTFLGMKATILDINNLVAKLFAFLPPLLSEGKSCPSVGPLQTPVSKRSDVRGRQGEQKLAYSTPSVAGHWDGPFSWPMGWERREVSIQHQLHHTHKRPGILVARNAGSRYRLCLYISQIQSLQDPVPPLPLMKPLFPPGALVASCLKWGWHTNPCPCDGPMREADRPCAHKGLQGEALYMWRHPFLPGWSPLHSCSQPSVPPDSPGHS